MFFPSNYDKRYKYARNGVKTIAIIMDISLFLFLLDDIYIFDKRKSMERMRCLICDSDIAVLNGFNQFNILCTELPSGALLSGNISRTLKRDIEPATSRSTNLCKRYVDSYFFTSFEKQRHALRIFLVFR